MNKYLTRFNKLLDELNKETDYNGYEVLPKMEIADYFQDNFYSINNDMELTDEQEELVIDIIYDYYIDLPYDKMSEYSATNCVSYAISEYNSFEEFYKDYTDNYEEIIEKFDCYLD